jgi:hypothetical protein
VIGYTSIETVGLNYLISIWLGGPIQAQSRFDAGADKFPFWFPKFAVGFD